MFGLKFEELIMIAVPCCVLPGAVVAAVLLLVKLLNKKPKPPQA